MKLGQQKTSSESVLYRWRMRETNTDMFGRKVSRISQAELSARTGISQPDISDLERRQTKFQPSIWHLIRLSAYFGKGWIGLMELIADYNISDPYVHSLCNDYVYEQIRRSPN